MSIAIAIFLFFVLFAVILIAVSVALRYMESARKKQVFKMLETVAGQSSAPTLNLMKSKPQKKTLLESMFGRLDLVRKLRARLAQADLTWRVEIFFAVSVGLAIVGAVVGARLVSINPSAGAAGAGLLFAFLPYFFISRKRGKRISAMDEQLPDALEFLARSMRAGHALTVSLGMLGEELPEPLGREFRTMFNEQRLGGPLEAALNNLCDRVPLQDLKFFASALLLQRQTGGNLAEILRQLSTVIRERFRLKGQVKALSAHGRMTSMILTGLPIITTFLLNLVAPEYLGSMFKDPDGQKLVFAAVVMVFIGSVIIQKIIKIKV
jgi:tight adherence protein B